MMNPPISSENFHMSSLMRCKLVCLGCPFVSLIILRACYWGDTAMKTISTRMAVTIMTNSSEPASLSSSFTQHAFSAQVAVL